MPYRRIPRTVPSLQVAMVDAKEKSENSIYQAILPATLATLNVFLPEYDSKVMNMNIALGNQLEATLAEDAAFEKCRLLALHYFQVFNLGIRRGKFPDSARAFYGIDVSDTRIPVIRKKNDALYWSQEIITGDAVRLADGGAAMTNPDADEIETMYNEYNTLHNVQSEMKDAYDDAQEEVAAMFKPAQELVNEMWDEVEFFFRGEHDIHSKRRKCRGWGVVYVSTFKRKISGTITDESTGQALEGVTVKIVQTDEAALTNDSGAYKLSTTLTGTGTLEFSLGGYETFSTQIEIHKGGKIVQDAVMKIALNENL